MTFPESASRARQVRVFISSTFRDMHAERDHLVTVVFPELRERVEQLGLEFFDVDLRWGVPAKDANGETANSWEYCRQWIDRVEPLFVCMLGQRYGYRPEPHDLRDAAEQARQRVQRRSITDLEVRHAVLDECRKRRSYFYLRDTLVPGLASAADDLRIYREFVDPPEELALLDALKADIRACGRPVRDYPCVWTGSGFKDLEEFGRLVLDDLWSGVLRDERYVSKAVWHRVLGADPDGDPRYTDESKPVPRDVWEEIVALAKPAPESPLDAERQQMDAFAASRLRWFQGRARELQQLTEFLQSAAADAPRLTVVAAVPGQGKSALLAQLSTLVTRDSSYLITHFVGATERSASAHALVSRLLDELDRSGITWPAEEQKDGEEPKRDFNSLCLRLAQRLGDYAGERRIVILLDALNQLSDGHDLLWLPARLGPGVRVVVSCVDDPAAKADSPDQRALHALTSREPAPVRVALGPLTEADVRAIVVAYLREYCHELDAEHLDTLCAIEQARNPLYLFVMLNELRTLGGNDLNRVVPERIASMAQDHPDTVSLFRWVLQRLEVFNVKAPDAVQWWCLYLAHGRVGMASHELADLLARKFGPTSAAAAEEARRTALRIERGLRRYLQRRGPQLDFFHGQLRQAVVEHCGPLAGTDDIHAGIAAYFRDLADPGNDRSWSGESPRALLEVAFHLAGAQLLDALCQILCDLRFVEARCRIGQVFELIADYHLARQALPEAQAELQRTSEQRRRARRWAEETVAYALAWSARRDQEARGDAVPWEEPRWPEPVPLCEMWSDAVIAAECDRIVGAPAGRHALDAFARFVESACYPLVAFGSRPGFVAQHAFNYASAGAVLDAARERLSAASFPAVLRRRPADASVVARPACERTLAGHRGTVTCVSVTADGLRAVSGGYDGTLRLWDLESGACLRTLAAYPPVVGLSDPGGVSKVLMTPDGLRAVSLGGNDIVRVWNLDTGDAAVSFEACRAADLAMTPDGRLAISGSDHGAVCVWDLDSGTCLRTLQEGADGWYHDARVAVSPDGRRAVSSTDACSPDAQDLHAPRVLMVWDVASGACEHVLEGHRDRVENVRLTADGRRAVSSDHSGTVRTWNLEAGACVRVLDGLKFSAGWCLTPDGRRAIAAGINWESHVWDLASGACLRTLVGHSHFVRGVAVSADGRRAVTASNDGTLRVWNLESGKCAAPAERHICQVRSVALARAGRLAVSIGDFYDTTLRVWDAERGACLRRLESASYDERWIEGSIDDGRQGISATEAAFRTWNLETGACVGTQEGRGYGRGINGAVICLTPDGRHSVIGGGETTTLRVWDLKSGTCLWTMDGHEGWVTTVCAAPDGRYVISGSRDKTLRVWNLASGRCVRALTGHAGSILGAAMTPDGRRAVSASADRTLRIWDLESGMTLKTLEGHEGAVGWVHVLPDGRHAVSGSGDKTVRVWNLSEGTCLAVFFADARVTSGAVLKNRLAVGVESGEVIFADLQNFAWGIPVIPTPAEE